ncbi:hypothetical protein AAFF_G00440350 [Aldrovandia affinis]|uniref:Uncharacterized protein n=1 Tax=Aldrovandia affinis TaxID=143900 RepID=A0AAD7S742_9TELE|nr:hypothetical protein AAFF_G00440350 [Aldrovandia affinis]
MAARNPLAGLPFPRIITMFHLTGCSVGIAAHPPRLACANPKANPQVRPAFPRKGAGFLRSRNLAAALSSGVFGEPQLSRICPRPLTAGLRLHKLQTTCGLLCTSTQHRREGEVRPAGRGS